MEVYKEQTIGESSDWMTIAATPGEFTKTPFTVKNVYLKKNSKFYRHKRYEIFDSPKVVLEDVGFSHSIQGYPDRNSTVCLDGKAIDLSINLSPIKKKAKRPHVVPLRSSFVQSIASRSESSHSKVSHWLASYQYAIGGPTPDNEIRSMLGKSKKLNEVTNDEGIDKGGVIEKQLDSCVKTREISPIKQTKTQSHTIEENSFEYAISHEISIEHKENKKPQKKRKKRRRITMPKKYRYIPEKTRSHRYVRKSIFVGKKLPISPTPGKKLWIRNDCPYSLRGIKLELSLRESMDHVNDCKDDAVSNQRSIETPIDKNSKVGGEFIEKNSKRKIYFDRMVPPSQKEKVREESEQSSSNSSVY